MKFHFKVSPASQSTVLKLLTNDWIVLDQLCQLKSVAQFRQSKYKVKVDNQVFKLGGWIGTDP